MAEGRRAEFELAPLRAQRFLVFEEDADALADARRRIWVFSVEELVDEAVHDAAHAEALALLARHLHDDFLVGTVALGHSAVRAVLLALEHCDFPGQQARARRHQSPL